MNRKAFTLIELLVVIAIVALLAAILFPVFARAKGAAKSSACLSGARQLGTAMALYAADYDDVYPNATDGFGGESQEGGWVYYNFFGNFVQGNFVAKKGGLYPYVKSEGIFVCPACPGPRPTLTYALNGCLTEPTDRIGLNSGRAASVVPAPSNMMLLGEEGVGEGGWSGKNLGTNDGFFNPAVDVFSEWHFGKTQLVFADLHAKSVKASDSFASVVFGGGPDCP
jgi:prepilin-type N-terminal cleavage/methylation domain-containing protein